MWMTKTWKSFCNRLERRNHNVTKYFWKKDMRGKKGRGWNLNTHKCCKKKWPRLESRQHPTSHPCLGAAAPHHWKSKRERRVFKTSCLPPVGLFVHHKSKKQSPLRNERTSSKRSKIKETLYWTFVASLELDLEFRALSSRFQAAFLAVAEKKQFNMA